MDDPLRPESPSDRMARAVARVNAATVRVSQAQETLRVAQERLALARLTCEDPPARGVHDPLWDDAARKGMIVRKTIQELREERGESQAQLAAAIGVTTTDVAEWEAGVAEPTISRLRVLTQHFGVRNDQINLRPGDPPSFGDRFGEAFEGPR